MYKRIFGLLLVFCLTMGMFCTTALADEESVTEIGTLEQLQSFAAKVNGGDNFAGKKVVLTADIDLGNTSVIIGNDMDHYFSGTFDGQNHVIKNLKINEPTGDLIGLFGYSVHGNFKNIILENVDITGKSNVGAIVGDAFVGTIDNCHVRGNISIKGNYKVGGITGYTYANITNCTVIGAANGTSKILGEYLEPDAEGDNVGGIVGFLGEGNTIVDNCKVQNVSVVGTRKVGGIAGNAYQDNTISDVAVSDITVGTNASADYANDNKKTMGIGGIVGVYTASCENDGEISGTISDITMTNTNDVFVSAGYITGGLRGTETPIAPDDNLSVDIAFEGDRSGASENAPTVNGIVNKDGESIAKMGNKEYSDLQTAFNAAAAMKDNVTVEILKDVDLTGKTWTPVNVFSSPLITVNGNNHIISGLNNSLFGKTFAGTSGLIINNLTIKNSNIVNDENDEIGEVGVGAFIGFPEASNTITLNNCHLLDSTVKGGHWTGGLIGIAGGYAGDDGPEFMELTIKNCSVENCDISGKGAVGGVIGHGSCSAWTNVNIENTTVKNNNIKSLGSKPNKAGSVMGTIGMAGQTVTVGGVSKTGGCYVEAKVSDNTVVSNETTITTIYGRQGEETAILTLTGGQYDSCPIEENVDYAVVEEGKKLTSVGNNYGVIETNPSGGNGGGGAVEETYYDVKIVKAENGTVKADKTTATEGEKVTLTVTPNKGWQTDKLNVVDKKDRTVKVTKESENKFTFVMPKGNVTVTATFVAVENICDGTLAGGCYAAVFSDINTGLWYHEAIDYVISEEIMDGMGNNKFEPNYNLTRAMLMTMLARMEGVDTANGKVWYEKGMAWAVENGISDGTFPDKSITREQIVTMLWRYAGKPSGNGDTSLFKDGDKISDYAQDAMKWALENNIVKGSGNNMLNPKGLASRAEVAQIFFNYFGK